VGAATILLNWAATQPPPQVQARAGPSKAEDTHLHPPSTHEALPLGSPPPSPSNKIIVIKKDWAKEKSRRQADAAASKPKPTKAAKAAPTRNTSLPRIPAAKKAKAREKEPELEDEATRPKKFQELDEDESAMEVEIPPSPKSTKLVHQPKAAAGKRRAIATGELHLTPCGNCQRASSVCMKETGGGVCVRCITQKHKCDYSRAWGGGKKNTKGKQHSEASCNIHSKNTQFNIEHRWKLRASKGTRRTRRELQDHQSDWRQYTNRPRVLCGTKDRTM
jgi:hypothetical protein